MIHTKDNEAMHMTRHRMQRVGVFVDVQNLYYSAKSLYQRKVNFKNLLEDAVAGRDLIRAIAYVIKADMKDETNFHEALHKVGFEVRAKDLQVFLGGVKKGDWDVGIAMDMMRIASKLDTAVLVSGDGDFTDLLHHMKSLGCRTEVISFGKTSSSKLITEADYAIDLDMDQKRYLIPMDARSRGPPQRRPRGEPRGRTRDTRMPLVEMPVPQPPNLSPPS